MIIKEARIQRKTWALDDEYLVIPEIQVFQSEGFEQGDTVIVTITKKEVRKRNDKTNRKGEEF